jgi:outer membrane protein assembly factor BamB
MHRIVIDVENLTDEQANRVVREIRERIPNGENVWAVRVPHRELNGAEITVSEKVWIKSRSGQGVELRARQVDALWQRILNDSRIVRAFRAP